MSTPTTSKPARSYPIAAPPAPQKRSSKRGVTRAAPADRGRAGRRRRASRRLSLPSPAPLAPAGPRDDPGRIHQPLGRSHLVAVAATGDDQATAAAGHLPLHAASSSSSASATSNSAIASARKPAAEIGSSISSACSAFRRASSAFSRRVSAASHTGALPATYL